MRRFAATMLALFTVSLLLAATQIVSSQPIEKSTTASERGHKLPVFDFENYKRLFKRDYLGVEELTRRNNFNARAVRVAIAAIKYQNGEMSYYLAINRFSDATQEELDMMRNRVLEEELVTESSSSKYAESVEQPVPANLKVGNVDPNDDIEAKVRQLINDNPKAPELKELNEFLNTYGEQSRQRNKRDVSKTKTERKRRLPMSKLINTGDDAELEQDIGAKAASSLPGRNKLYKPYELPSYGLLDEQSQAPKKELFRDDDLWLRVLNKKFDHGQPNPTVKPEFNQFLAEWQKRLERRGIRQSDDLSFRQSGGLGFLQSEALMTRFLSDQDAWNRAQRGETNFGLQEQAGDDAGESLPDAEFSDLRRGGCFLSPRYQGSCGSCYAFAFTTVLEWLYCKKTGKLVAFSQQYMIDCGKAYVIGMDGCNGASFLSSTKFVHNFGLELHRNYPYMEREQYCPYEKHEPRNITGYIRPDLKFLFVVELENFAKYLEHMPIIVYILSYTDHLEYGGGVFDIPCGNDTTKWNPHGAIVVGHGREGGKEYWLVRNSLSTGWGERGYYKVAKTTGCIKRGFLYGVKDSMNIDINVDNNQIYDERRIKDAVPKALNKKPIERSQSFAYGTNIHHNVPHREIQVERSLDV